MRCPDLRWAGSRRWRCREFWRPARLDSARRIIGATARHHAGLGRENGKHEYLALVDRFYHRIFYNLPLLAHSKESRLLWLVVSSFVCTVAECDLFLDLRLYSMASNSRRPARDLISAKRHVLMPTGEHMLTATSNPIPMPQPGRRSEEPRNQPPRQPSPQPQPRPTPTKR